MEGQKQPKEQSDRIEQIPGVPLVIKRIDMDKYSQQPWKPSAASLPIPKYDGITDPRDHVTAFTTSVKGNGRDSRSKQENPRYDHRSRDRESGSSSRFGKERNTRETRDDDSSKAKIGGYSFNISTSELVAVLRSMGDKIKAIEEIPDILTSKKEVQRLTGRITALGRFISKSSEKCFKFFSALKKQNQFEWSEECQQALKNLKAYLSNPPLRAKPKSGEKLLVYLTVLEVAVSVVLVREDQDAETRYPHLEKLALALIMTSRKLRPYFQCHPISVVTAYPLRNILYKQELSSGLAKWAIELSEYDITYQPRTAIKSQVLADFVEDFSQGILLEAEKELQLFNRSNPGAGLGIVLVPPAGETIRQAIKCHPITNNEAEYEDVIIGLELARQLGIEQVMIKSDSQLVVNQMQGTYTAREARMQQYLEKIPREENAEIDALANLVSAAEVTNKENSFVIHLFHSVLDQDKNEVNYNNLTWDWKNEIVNFLEYGILPEDKKKTQALCQKAARYCLNQGNLYRKMFGGPLAKCLGPSQMEYVMREIHEGHYGNHAGGRALVKTIIRVGYYWPKMEEDGENFMAKCDKCQRYGNNMHQPAELLHPVVVSWPFMKWGMDIVGPLLQAKGKVRFLLVFTDYITKWVEAGAFNQVREKEVRDFIWRNITCQFGMAKKIVCDNGPQFIGAQITNFFQSWRIKRITSTPYHPVGNAQVESTNKVIINNLKKRLEESKGS
uniref:Integrase catalytic domain-containing protein n=1 Tax=Nicotiana tabacum TaxID=4097 RepID=A0A1S4A2P3_TOBAC|nr:PREDICTED: uncharacterized protein LOC107793073 [Nicotiana tabacum]